MTGWTMNDDMVEVKLPRAVAEALASTLLNPVKDLHERTVYALSVTLGGELRRALAVAMEGK